MLFQLFNDIAPHTVATMTGLANSGYFNGQKFSAIAKSGGQPFYIAGGSPTGTTTGGPGFLYDDEFNPNAIFSNPGVLATLNLGGAKDTDGSQFIITDQPVRSLDFNNNIWGQLVRGFGTLSKFFDVPVINGTPTSGQRILSASIVTDTSDAVLLVKATEQTSANVTVNIDDGIGGTDSQTFHVDAQPDTYNDPPILMPVPNMVRPKNKTVSIQLGSIDLEGDPVQYNASVGDPSELAPNGLSVIGDVVTLTPRRNFTGALELFVGVAALGESPRGSAKNPYDTQQIQIGFGDLPATGSALAIDAISGESTGTVAIANFRDSDPRATAADWNAVASKLDGIGDRTGGVNWGDDTITDGSIIQNRNESFSIVGSHVYPASGQYPITVVVDGNLGAQLTMNGVANVRNFATIVGSTLTVNGTSGDDVIAVSLKSGNLNVTVNGTSKKYPASGIARVNVPRV